MLSLPTGVVHYTSEVLVKVPAFGILLILLIPLMLSIPPLTSFLISLMYWTGKYKIDYGTVCLPIWGSISRPLLIRFDQQSSPPLGVMLSEYAGWHMAGVTRDKGVNAAQLPLHDYNLASISPHHICSSLSCLPCLSNSYVLHWVILLSRQMLKSEY